LLKLLNVYKVLGVSRVYTAVNSHRGHKVGQSQPLFDIALEWEIFPNLTKKMVVIDPRVVNRKEDIGIHLFHIKQMVDVRSSIVLTCVAFTPF
jgi:hypothetical protein